MGQWAWYLFFINFHCWNFFVFTPVELDVKCITFDVYVLKGCSGAA